MSNLWNSATIARKSDEEIQRETADPEVAEAIERTRNLCNQIVVQIPHRQSEGLHHKLLEHSIQWVTSGIAVMPFRDPFGGFIDLTRSFMVTEFLRSTDRKYLVMLDNDVIPYDALSVVKLCSHDKPVVSGVACGFTPGTGVFACVGVKDKTGVARFPTTMDTKTMPAHGLRVVESCGTGILAIRRDVLEAIVEPPFLLPDEVRIEAAKIGNLRMGEDIWFSKQVQKAGFEMYVDFSVQCMHDKNIPLHWPTGQIDETLDAADWDVTAAALPVEKD